MFESYITVKKRSKFEYEDRKSVFIGEAFPIKSENDALMYIASVKKEYPDAKHHVYAYVLRENSIMRFTDDGEPQGTAGMPMLDVIRKKGCTDVLVIVTRYFGGTLLGTGGLVKAYTSAAVGALENAVFVTYDVYSNFHIEVNYSDYQKLISLLASANFTIEDTKFTDTVNIYGKIKKSQTEQFREDISELTSGRIKTVILSENFDCI